MQDFRAALDRWRRGDAAGAFAAIAALPDFPGNPRAARRWARLGDAEVAGVAPVIIECPWGRFVLRSGFVRPGQAGAVPALGAREVRDFLRVFLAWAEEKR